MTAEAPPVSPEASGPSRGDSTGSAVLASAVRGFAAFAIVTAVGVAIGLAEYATTNGAYRLWTWIKVGFLYLLSFCGVGLHVDSAGTPALGFEPIDLTFRLPMMTGTALVLWLLFRAGRSIGDRLRDIGRRRAVLGAAAAALGFALPASLVSLPSILRFPDLAGRISPVRWEAAVLPLALASVASVAGALWGRRPAGRVAAAIAGGWSMFLASIGLMFVAFLILAAVKPDQTGGYAKFIRDSGRLGAVEVSHHALMLPDQSIWLLGPAMGGSAQVSIVVPGASPTMIKLTGIEGGSLARLLYPNEAFNAGDHLVLGGGFYLFLLVPAGATLLGGRRAATGSHRTGERALRGAGAGVVFGALIAAAAWFSASLVPLPLFMVGFPSILPASIHATMPSTAVLALVWGVAGGMLGALSSRWPSSTAAGQELAEPA